MNDMPMSPMDEEMSDDMKSEVDKMLKNKSISDVRKIANYCHKCASEAHDKTAEEVTMEDFYNAKKADE